MKNSVVLILCILMFSCKKADVESDVPRPVQKEITEFSKNTTCVSARVDEFVYQGQKVYLFDPGLCGADMTTAVVDKEGRNMGYLGGFAGNSMINGENFDSAEFIRTVWQKTP